MNWIFESRVLGTTHYKAESEQDGGACEEESNRLVILGEAKDLCAPGQLHRSFAANNAAQDDKGMSGAYFCSLTSPMPTILAEVRNFL